MNTQEYLQKKYQQLCQELGDAEYRMYQFQKTVETKRKEIQELNRMTPELMSLEKLIISDLKTEIENKVVPSDAGPKTIKTRAAQREEALKVQKQNSNPKPKGNK